MAAPAYKIEEEHARPSTPDEMFTFIKEWLDNEAMSMEANGVEGRLEIEGRELLRLLYQSHIDARKEKVALETVVGSDGKERTHRRVNVRRLFLTLFGLVFVYREGFEGRELNRLYPLDAEMNLPNGKFSFKLSELCAIEASKSSYDEVVESLQRYTGQKVGKRQVERLVVRASQDFNEFYIQNNRVLKPMSPESLLVLSSDGKGIVMRHGSLRPETQKAAMKSKHKMKTRLSAGEKRNRKRMATVCSVYQVSPWIRTPEDVVKHMRATDPDPQKDTQDPRPKPEQKRVWAEIVESSKDTISQMFDEAERRDPNHEHQWVVLVDGDSNQLDYIKKEAKKRGVSPTIIIDFIHVLEYLWKAAHLFHRSGSKKAEDYVFERLLRLLKGRGSYLAAGIVHSARLRGFEGKKLKRAKNIANYIRNLKNYLNYDEYLALGMPIATGVIEGACRYLVKDRMDITGARWELTGAEAVLRLRALRASGDFDRYWAFHLEQERVRNHHSRYAESKPPRLGFPERFHHLRLVE